MRVFVMSLMVTLIVGCSSPKVAFVYETDSDEVFEGVESYEFQVSDSIKVNYSFWGNNGVMSFTITNISDKPIYIDWKKSSYIDNNVKLNYYNSNEKVKSVALQKYLGTMFENSINSTSTSIISKEERVTFIPPNSQVNRKMNFIWPNENYKFTKSSDTLTISEKKEYIQIFEEFEKSDSPLIFRNFLTYSFDEDFTEEHYVDNEFYISSVKSLPYAKQFIKRLNEDGEYYYQYKYKGYNLFTKKGVKKKEPNHKSNMIALLVIGALCFTVLITSNY